MQKMMSLALVVFSINMISIILLRTCFKSSSKPTSIHLFLTTRNAHFRNTVAVCSSLSDFHKLALTVLKTFDKNKPCEILQRDCKNLTLKFLMKIYKIFYLQHK